MADLSPGGVQQAALQNQFLFMLGAAVQQATLYEPDNKVMADPIQRLERTLKQILGEAPTFTFQGVDQTIFVNGQRLRCDGTAFNRHQVFLKLLAARKASGMAFNGPLEDSHWKGVLGAVARVDRNSASPFEDIEAALAKAGLSELVGMMPTGAQAAVAAAKKVRGDKRLFAIRAYAKAMHLLREYIKHLADPVRRGYFHVKLLRVAQDLVTTCEQDGWKYIGLVNNKDYHAYLYNHSVNVAMLSLVLGVRLGLRRERLAELAMAALLHDVGKAMLPREIMDKRGTFTDEEKKILGSAPELGVKSLLAVRQYNEALLKRIVVIGEHGEAMGERSDHHAYSRIVAIAETYDALTTDRPHRAAFLPDAAMKMLMKLADSRLDRGLVAVFAQAVGMFPCGTLAEISDGSLAIVFHPHPDRKLWTSPIVRLVRDAAKQEIRKPPVVDLSAAKPGEEPRYITRTLEPAAAGVNISACLYEDPA
jgi:HD-GYP domain-containing protein (c-di-GMP phosphodiesterase class II)